MSTAFFRHKEEVQIWTVPGGVSEMRVYICGGGTHLSYLPFTDGTPQPPPYFLFYPATGFFLTVDVEPGDVLEITVGNSSYEAEGGWPDGGSGREETFPYADGNCAAGGGGSTRIVRNGELWMVAGGEGGAVTNSLGKNQYARVVTSSGPGLVVPYDIPDEVFFEVLEEITGNASGTDEGASSSLWSGRGSTIDFDSMGSEEGLLWPDVLVAGGGGGGGYYGGASGSMIRGYFYLQEIEDEEDPWTFGQPGQPGASLMPAGWEVWEPEAGVSYGEPGNPGYDPDLGGIPDPGFQLGGDYIPDAYPPFVDYSGSPGFVRFRWGDDGWAVGRVERRL